MNILIYVLAGVGALVLLMFIAMAVILSCIAANEKREQEIREIIAPEIEAFRKSMSELIERHEQVSERLQQSEATIRGLKETEKQWTMYLIHRKESSNLWKDRVIKLEQNVAALKVEAV